MADFLVEIADYAASLGIGTVATTSNNGDIFNEEVPGSPDNVICFIGQPGPLIGDQRSVAKLTFPRFQVYVRNVSYPNGSTKLKAVRDALHGLNGVALPSWKILRCHAEQEGGPIGSDEQNRFEFTVNFVAEIHDQPS